MGSEGEQLLELDGTNGIEREFLSTIENSYFLNFDYSPRPGLNSGSNQIEVVLNGNVVQELNGDGETLDTAQFEKQGIDLNVIEGVNNITFRATGNSSRPGYGGLLDNIRLERSENQQSDNVEVTVVVREQNGGTVRSTFNLVVADNETT